MPPNFETSFQKNHTPTSVPLPTPTHPHTHTHTRITSARTPNQKPHTFSVDYRIKLFYSLTPFIYTKRPLYMPRCDTTCRATASLSAALLAGVVVPATQASSWAHAMGPANGLPR